MKLALKKVSFTDFILLATIIFIGGFNEYVACALSVIMSAYLICKIIKTKSLNIKLNIFNISITLICAMYGITALWAVDFGMALIGFLKYFPIPLYLILIWQNKETKALDILPCFASVLVVLSIIGMYVSFTSSFFSVAGRLSGFFQYPNTFALFLLICELLLVRKEKLKIIDIISLVIIIIGLLYTGSRTAFVLAIIVNVILFAYKFRKGINKKYILWSLGVILAIGAVVLLVNKDILTRFSTISIGESAFVGRILYWIDALPLILKYPFGMGYLGYNFIQTSIQTGLYTVRFIHNDFLQLILDVGFIPAGLFIFGIFQYLFNKQVDFYNKIIVIAICAHSFFEFNLQFLAIWFIFLIITNEQSGKEIVLNKKLGIINFALVVFALVNIYMGIHLGLSYFNKNEAAEKLYPYNTDNKIAMLEQTSDVKIANKLANDILEQNKHSYIPYTIKAKHAYSVGDFASLIQHKQTTFSMNPFNYEEYKEYCKMLINGIYLYNQNGDIKSAQYCMKELVLTKIKLERVTDLQSSLGKLIKDQPQTTLPEEIIKYIDNCEKELKNAQ